MQEPGPAIRRADTGDAPIYERLVRELGDVRAEALAAMRTMQEVGHTVGGSTAYPAER
ncbi:hypothetical protein ACH429_20930 [Streptomyces pathocidini]|uniref:GNAT family N-acetyltransferase n=2 Tax=Streptomyces pathocidini TaxID=1650571 RepID=A0ABW7UXF5_9ACTN|nr:hypothetical protein [Streptomyces pathocidini]